MRKLLLSEVRKLNPFNDRWLTAENKLFFGDIEYRAWEHNGKKYFIQGTKKWTDIPVYLVREIQDNGAIGDTIKEFPSMLEAERFISKLN